MKKESLTGNNDSWMQYRLFYKPLACKTETSLTQLAFNA